MVTEFASAFGFLREVHQAVAVMVGMGEGNRAEKSARSSNFLI